MPWVRIDEDFVQHPKVVQVGPFGVALQVAALCYANRNLTDGFVPYGAVRMLLDFNRIGENIGEKVELWSEVGAMNIASRLVEAGLWEEVEDGFQIHDFEDYQPSRQDVLAEREKTRDRVAKHRAAKRKGNAAGNSRSNAVTNAPVTPPPVPVPVPLNHGVVSEGDTEEIAEGVLTVVEFDAQTSAPTRRQRDIQQVLDTWNASRLPRTPLRLTVPRRKAIQARLREFGLPDCLDAAVGWRNDPWVGRAEQNDIAILFRPSNFEKMRDLARDGPPLQLGKRTRETVNNRQGMHAVGLAKGVIGNGNGLEPVDQLGRPDQRELARPADRTADRR